ncbi:SusC/RagA family TonB-linked outer membrane protein [Porphyromonas levii]|uniref:SusC/RagA family TonB-linked outer membrane protein n=2 Tax=Porphyromonas levii TaxID=28114 RepID=A0A4Y8WN70_9PORP|nr:SusC/RagA family TonB-linked outer membrane protein [Porphyromonas levii]TFH95686.1 SusC/RagA family TonB-linked outer membrane protein [Porphyromonas levii]
MKMKKSLLFKAVVCLYLVLCLPLLADAYASAWRFDLQPLSPMCQQPHNPKVTLNLEKASVATFFEELKKQTSVDFVYSTDLFDRNDRISIKVNAVPMSAVLDDVLTPRGLTYMVTGQIVTIKKNSSKRKTRIVSGLILDDKSVPLTGAIVADKKTKKYAIADADGRYQLEIPCDEEVSLKYSMVGVEPTEIKIKSGDKDVVNNVTLSESVTLEEVVVTGVYTRPVGNYTGSALSIAGDDLRKVGGNNALSSLKNVDPAIYIPDNFSLGSDPNKLPDVSLRGTSSISMTEGNSLKSGYTNNPNQPLFILDGFEVSIETVMDMDMNRIESMTTLKDASAKALYGSKAANGVIVIQTKKLKGDEHRVTYSGMMTLDVPDLSSYNLTTDGVEKLEVEKLDGVYENKTSVRGQEVKDQLYNKRKLLVLQGLSTDWISKPIRVGFGHKHSISVELGDSKSLRATIDFTYRLLNGAMKGSSRNNLSTSMNLSYRKNNLLFRNVLTVTSNVAEDSPYGKFSDYARMNPYWQAQDAKGNVLRWAEENIPNPLYDATIGTSLKSKYLQMIDNFFTEWTITPNLKANFRLGVMARKNELDHFLPPLHSSFALISEDKHDTRGSYTVENGSNSNYSGNLNINYNTSIGKHSFFTNAGVSMSEAKGSTYQHIARGFANASATDITFAKGYQEGTKPVGYSTLTRDASMLLFASYDYDSRYLLEGTFRESASSLYGRNNRWSPSWSIGLGWNMHNEKWLSNKHLQRLKVRASLGLTGNQNFTTNSAIPTYRYYSGVVYGNQTGAYLSIMPNPDLKWEQKMDYNVGMDLMLKGLSVTFDLYTSDTRNMLTDLAIPTITGFSVVKDNLGLIRNSGLEARFSYNIWQSDKGFFNVFGSAVTNKNYIVRLSDSLREYNERMMKKSKESNSSSPVPLFQDGQSMTTIFAIKSAGIDPTNGKELFIKRDGTLTYDYDPTDLCPVGDTAPKLRGTCGINAEYKGFGLNLTLGYLMGAQAYNATLVDKVENANITYNVDRRLAQGRWRTPGQVTKFKKFDSHSRTRPTTRFIQERNELTISALSLYYDVPLKFCKPLHMQRLKLSCNANNLHTFSSIEIERGTAYPFARQFSFSMIATF